VPSRIESAAATRRSLLQAAASLLDEGGPEAVTLREVGARAGVSRGAPYRHFDDKDSLLSAVAAEAWGRLADQAVVIAAAPDVSAPEKLRDILTAILTIGREQPHLHRLMNKPPPSPDMLREAGRSQAPFISVLGELTGDAHAHLYGAILLAGTHGIIGMEAGGQLTRDKWHTDADEVLEKLIALIPSG